MYKCRSFTVVAMMHLLVLESEKCMIVIII